jgi:polyadenylate-binding protein
MEQMSHLFLAAEKALEKLNFEVVGGRSIRIMHANRDPNTRRSSNNNLFIKKLPVSIDNKALWNLFSQFGKILSCKV